MGNRARIQLTNNDGEVSPVLYLHWGGSDVADILTQTQSQMRTRANDIEYAFARLVQQAIGNDDGNTGFGVSNQIEKLTASDSHGDAGCFVVDISDAAWKVAQGGGYGLEGGHSFDVSDLA